MSIKLSFQLYGLLTPRDGKFLISFSYIILQSRYQILFLDIG